MKKDAVKPNIVDRVVSFLNPEAGRKRAYHRTMLALSGGYGAADRSKRSLKGWRITPADADTILGRDLPTLRDSSSALIRDNPLACGAINTNVTSVVGTGLKVKPSINREYLNLTEEQADAWENRAKFEFNVVAKSIDYNGKHDFWEQQDLVFRSSLEKGDSFALITNKERKDLPYSVAVQLVEAERVSNPNNRRDSDQLIQGVSVDRYGTPTHINIRTKHPGSGISKERRWRKISFRSEKGNLNVLHVVRHLRIGQTRGIPYLTPVIEALKQVGTYTDAELMAAVIGGMYTVFIKSETDDDLDDMEGNEGSVSSEDLGDYELGNGAIVGLAENESIDIANPGRPNVAFDPFVLAVLRQVGVALELPFELLIKHFTASYSAAQAAMLEARRYFTCRRTWLVRRFCQPIYEAVIDEAVALGRLHAPGYFADPFVRQAYLGTIWIGDAYGHIDTRKAAEGEKVWNELGVKTLDEITMETTGRDWETNHKQSVKEQKARKEDGLIVEDGAQVQRLTVENED